MTGKGKEDEEGGFVVEAGTEGVLINKSKFDTPLPVRQSVLNTDQCGRRLLLLSQHQTSALRWSKSAMSLLMWASFLCRYSQRSFSLW